jgi:hypothetical protein
MVFGAVTALRFVGNADRGILLLVKSSRYCYGDVAREKNLNPL